MIEGKPQAFWEAISIGILDSNAPPSKFLKIWNDDGWFLPEQIGKSKNELDKFVTKGLYRKVVISVYCEKSIRRSCRRALYKKGEGTKMNGVKEKAGFCWNSRRWLELMWSNPPKTCPYHRDGCQYEKCGYYELREPTKYLLKVRKLLKEVRKK